VLLIALFQHNYRPLRRAAVLAPPLVVLLFAALLFDGIQRRRSATAQVQQVEIVMREMQEIQTRISDAETAQRGYLITGLETYLEPFHGAEDGARDGLQQLAVVLSAYPKQVARVRELQRLVDERFLILGEVLEERRRGGFESGRQALLARGGQQVMNRIRSGMSELLQAEQARLDTYSSAQERATRVLLVTLVLGSLLVLAVSVLTNSLFRRHAEEQQRLNDELADANVRLQNQAAELEMQTQELNAQTLYLEDTTAELESSNDELERQRAAMEELSRGLAAANEELRELNVALRERTEEAERANRGKTDFLAAMSHELRTPLNAVIGYVDLMELEVYGASNEAQLAALARIKGNARHLLTLINDVLHFAKLQAGRIEFKATPVPLHNLLSEADEVMAPLVRAKQIRFERTDGVPDVPVVGDQDRIRQILLNLLSNAVKYTESGGRVTLETKVDDGRVRIQVRDTGAGIPSDMLETIFDPFVQLRRGPGGQLTDGVGLGLSISRELARAMAGELEVESEEGAGSTFTLTLQRGTGGSAAGAREDGRPT
jgi:signal transduction histidine kinase